MMGRTDALVCTTTPSSDLRTNRRERNPRLSASWPKFWSCRIDRLFDRLTAVTIYPHVRELPIAQGIGTPICGCLGFRGRVSEVRILPGPLLVFRSVVVRTDLSFSHR